MKTSKIRDFDPESLLDPAPSSSDNDHTDGDASDIEDAQSGREHYAAVGKSKLRKPDEVRLGPEYAGRSVSRKELQDSDSDDPFARGFDETDSEASDQEDLEAPEGVKLDDDYNREELADDDSDEELTDKFRDDDEDDDDDDDDDDASDKEFHEDDAESADVTVDDDTQDSSSDGEGDGPTGDAKATGSTIRSLMNDTKSFTSTIAASASSDVSKGQAVKTQRKLFDTLLNTRIRLQKALISTNSMVAEPHKTEVAPDAPIEAAETAALTLLNNLTDLRRSLEESRTGNKRRRLAFDATTPSSEIWSNIRETESVALSHRKAVLERWSNKTKATNTTNNKARLNAAAQQTLTEVLDSQLTSSHLVERTRTPRSCAPLQSSVKGALPDHAIYDDADFYGLLLKELLEQRSADLNANGAAEFVVQAPWQVARDAKTKKVVDTKASKGRKLRYTVQEKLQNFMAPEERGQWDDRQRDELFSSLFGQRLGLGEQDDCESEVDHDVDAEEAGLMLFRS